MRAAYAGHEAMTFTDYMDLETGRTLSAVPGGVYDIAPASGRVVPDFPEPWFTRAEDDKPKAGRRAAATEGDAAPEPGSEEEAGGEPAHDEDDHSAF